MGGGATEQTDSSGFGLGSMNYHGLGMSSLESVKKGYADVNNPELTGRQKAQRVGEMGGKLIGDWFTGGNVSPYMNAFEDKFPGAQKWFEKMDLQLNPLSRVFGHLFEGKGGKGLSFL